jgi:hypothetical protein
MNIFLTIFLGLVVMFIGYLLRNVFYNIWSFFVIRKIAFKSWIKYRNKYPKVKFRRYISYEQFKKEEFRKKRDKMLIRLEEGFPDLIKELRKHIK